MLPAQSFCILKMCVVKQNISKAKYIVINIFCDSTTNKL